MKFDGYTIKDIINDFKTLCHDGLPPSRIIKFRRAIKELSKKLQRDSKAFHTPLAKDLTIEIKSKKPAKPPKAKKKPKKKKEKKEEPVKESAELVVVANNEDIPAVKHILDG